MKKSISASFMIGMLFFSGLWSTAQAITDTVKIEVNVDVEHIVGNISSFDRKKFITIHADVTEQEWDGTNEVPDLRDDFLNGYDVYMGRNTGGISWYLNNQITEDQNRPGYADSADIATLGQINRNNYAANTNYHSYEDRNSQVICAQLHPFWPDGQKTNRGWAFSQTDTPGEAFGTATGEYMGHFIKEFFGTGQKTGPKTPEYVEVINEPLWHLVDYGSETPEKIFRFHNTVASEIKKRNPEIKIGGFCTAFPDLEKNNFNQWEERWKQFIDIAGPNMDFWTIHLYDFPSINNGKQLYRKGAQMEATFDMLEQYSYLTLGEVKPFLISEYGAQMHDYFGKWSPYRDWLHLKSSCSMLMQFMSRPNLINKAINFLIIKAEWGYNNSTGATYNHRLMRKANEPESYTGQWVYTDMVKLYQLWSDVKGIRVDAKANNLDVLTDAYISGNKAYVLINNLDLDKSHAVKTSILGTSQTMESLKIRHLHLEGSIPQLTETITHKNPNSINLDPEATLILEYTFSEDLTVDQNSKEEKYYATEYYKSISSNRPLSFTINNIQTGEFGEAVLRIGIGRSHGKELFPDITFNGTPLIVTRNYRGDDQKDRPSFFGVLEVEVPYALLQSNNQITIKFPDEGGYVSSVALQSYKFSRAINRFNTASTAIQTIDEEKIQIIPNPANTHISILSKSGTPCQQIEIFSLTGKKVLEEQIPKYNPVINLAKIPVGMYLVKIKTPTQFLSKALIVKR